MYIDNTLLARTNEEIKDIINELKLQCTPEDLGQINNYLRIKFVKIFINCNLNQKAKIEVAKKN